MGMLAVLRSIRKGAPVGIMVTASHNGRLDNGLKIADAHGGMLDASWEPLCTALANVGDETGDAVVAELKKVVFGEGIENSLTSLSRGRPGVFIGRSPLKLQPVHPIPACP